MYARIARFEGGDADAIRRAADEVAARARQPRDDIPAKRVLLLIDPDNGRSQAVVFFESEEDMRTGDAALRAMTPEDAMTGSRTEVEFYEVAHDIQM